MNLVLIKSKNNMSFSDNIVRSSIALSIAEFVTLPICTIKTLYQNNQYNHKISNVMSNHYKRFGIISFYNACIPAVSIQVMITSIKYSLYRHFQKYNVNPLLCGIGSGIVGSILSHPLSLCKIYLQMKKPLLNDIRNSGYRMMYRGYSKSFLKMMVMNSIFMPTYDFVNSMTNVVTSSIVTSALTTLIVQPFDYLKTRHIAGLSLYNNKNISIYYKGLTLNMARNMPHTIITMYIIENCQKTREN